MTVDTDFNVTFTKSLLEERSINKSQQDYPTFPPLSLKMALQNLFLKFREGTQTPYSR
jgi:hypothetical protein